MDDNQYYIKLSLISGIIGALAFPFIYECYANVMRGIAVVLAAVGCVYVSIRLSQLSLTRALCGTVFFIIISGGLGAFIELMVHDYVVQFLENRSKYFYMTYRDIAGFTAKLFMCYTAMFLICLGRAGIRTAVNTIRKNSDSSASFIDNAFGDDDE